MVKQLSTEDAARYSVEGFKAAFYQVETVELTNLDDPDALVTQDASIEAAIVDALDEYRVLSKGLLDENEIPVSYVYDIARYRLDYLDPREDVIRRYRTAIDFINDRYKIAASASGEGTGVGTVDTTPSIFCF